ncbi:uncharacterized protein TNCV_4666851 [Trichonephila clavipes]|nr:uncharacterized protein TNCV_4666851 [Trichonephila clavipes]
MSPPPHIGFNGNEIADSLAKSATVNALRGDACLTFAELFFIKRMELNALWRVLPAHSCPVSSCSAPLQTEALMGGRQGQHKCPSARRLRMVQEDTGTPREGATCAWMAADEAVGCTRAFLSMWRSSRRLVCQGHPELGLRVNDISRIHWSNISSQHNQSGLID